MLFLKKINIVLVPTEIYEHYFNNYNLFFIIFLVEAKIMLLLLLFILTNIQKMYGKFVI